MNGAATNPDCHVLAYAGAQVKKGLDVAKKLGAENFGTRPSILNVIYNNIVSASNDCLSSQCFGEEEKVFCPSITRTSLLS